ncbi:MAG: hypothetical protein ACOCQ4_00655 [bacterium]
MGFSSRKEMFVYYFLKLKKAEQNQNLSYVQYIVRNLEKLNLTDSEIEELEIKEYLKKQTKK